MPTNTQPQHRDKPIVYALDPLQPSAQALAEKHFRLRIRVDSEDHEWQAHAEGILVRGSYVTARDLEGATRLRFIAKHGVGVDKIDVAMAKKLGIRVMNTPGVNAVAVAELALALTMSVARKIPTIDRKIRSGEEGITKSIGLDGLTLHGRTIGILGGGNIGLAVGQMFHRCFGSSVLLYDPYLTPTAKALWTSSIPSEKISFVADLEQELYPRADVISLHIPLLPSTRGLIGARQLQLMRPTVILINTARGGIVDETDLLQALRDGTIYGAGLDAFEIEPPTLGVYSGFAECDNVVMTPHIGAGNADTQVACNLAMVQHLVDALVHDTPRDCVG